MTQWAQKCNKNTCFTFNKGSGGQIKFNSGKKFGPKFQWFGEKLGVRELYIPEEQPWASPSPPPRPRVLAPPPPLVQLDVSRVTRESKITTSSRNWESKVNYSMAKTAPTSRPSWPRTSSGPNSSYLDLRDSIAGKSWVALRDIPENININIRSEITKSIL